MARRHAKAFAVFEGERGKAAKAEARCGLSDAHIAFVKGATCMFQAQIAHVRNRSETAQISKGFLQSPLAHTAVLGQPANRRRFAYMLENESISGPEKERLERTLAYRRRDIGGC